MPWYIWLVVGAIVLSSLLSVAMVGKPRTPSTPTTVVFVLIVNALLVWAIVEGASR